MSLTVGTAPPRALTDDIANHGPAARQRLTSLPLLCTVSECANEQTVPTMLSNAEETLTTEDKPATIGALSDRDAASVPITEQTNDSPPGEDMDEDTTPLAIDTDTIEDVAYNGACWKVVRNKRRARNAAAHETASLRQNASEHPSAEPKQSGPKRLPPLPLRDEKVILRPHGGLRLDKWPRPTLATALWTAAGVSPNDRRDLILRTRPEQNLAIVSTPSSHVADALLNIQELSISQRTYPVSAYLAAPDDSCKGIVPGLEPGTPSHMLRQPFNRAWVKKAIEDEQRQLMASTNADPPSATTPASGTSFKKAGRSRSKTPSRSRPKARVNSKSPSRSRSQSSSSRNQVKRQTTPASQASPQPYKKALLNKLATSAATPDRQQAQAPENTNAKAAPRELGHVIYVIFSVHESNAPGPQAAPSWNNEPTGEKQGDAQPAAGSNIAVYLIACCACCCCAFIVVPSILVYFAANELVGRVLELMAPEEYEFAAWATVSDLHECSSVVRPWLRLRGKGQPATGGRLRLDHAPLSRWQVHRTSILRGGVNISGDSATLLDSPRPDYIIVLMPRAPFELTSVLPSDRASDTIRA
ncbi:hypothetical protein HPB49_019089 [Dermacentor silvarum]|uniref:Uncharacterized protein n=1 Tax=Dermacentor silvarum TaxID=543639 RepID=A0ACB8CGZ7_DERSI|nr:hypothetical protein HPB49_019089 [Dermacentor silvarum]